MRTVMKAALTTLLACGGLLLVLGIVIWTGDGGRLVGVHVTLGVVLVLSLWTISAVAARSGVPTGVAALAAGWGVVVVIVGLAHEELAPGSWHWVVEVLHVGISMGAIWWGRRLARLVRQARPAEPPERELVRGA